MAWRRVWCVLQTMCRSLYVDNVESRGPVGAEAEPLWGGLAGASPEATGAQKRIAEARREQLVLYVDSEATGTQTCLSTPRCPWSRG